MSQRLTASCYYSSVDYFTYKTGKAIKDIRDEQGGENVSSEMPNL